MAGLLPFPPQPAGVAWPTDEWEEAPPPPEAVDGRLDAKLDALVGPATEPAVGHTNALAVVHRGRIVAERYGEREMGHLAELAGVQPGPLGPADPLYSWSMAKSILHMAVGLLVDEGRIDITQPAPVPEWAGDDPRAAITWDDLLAMRPGLQWYEEYDDFTPDTLPDVVAMLYGEGQADVAAFAAGFPLRHAPGAPEAYYYSSGTTNIVARALQDVLGVDGDGMDAFLRERIFAPIGASPTFGHDPAGTWIASSFVDMVARDWLRFGLLALRGGAWDGRTIVSPGWMDHGRTPRSFDEKMGFPHGAHWWARPNREDGMFMAHGFEGQRLLMSPTRDVVLFRQGKTADADIDVLNDRLLAVVDLFPPTSGA